MRKHALLSASGSSRWLECPPSARLEEKVEDKESKYAEEGRTAHKLGEINLLYKLENIEKKEYIKKLEEIKKDEFYKEEMIGYVDKYVRYIMEQIKKEKERNNYVLTLVEKRLDISKWVKEGFGTADALIVCKDKVEVVDLKYGKGVEVKAKNNSQIMLYRLGVLNEIEFIYPIKKVKMTIVQPRRNNISIFEKSIISIYEFGEKVKPIAELAYEGRGKLKAGEHCMFCKVKVRCKEIAKKARKVERYKDKDINMLSHEELEEISNVLPILKVWIKAVEEYILDLAVDKGVKFKGKKIVEGGGKRKYVDEEKIKEVLLKEGYKEEEIVKKELLSIINLEKVLGKKKFNEVLGKYIIREKGKLQLVDESDKREEYSSAKEDFKDNFGLTNI